MVQTFPGGLVHFPTEYTKTTGRSPPFFTFPLWLPLRPLRNLPSRSLVVRKNQKLAFLRTTSQLRLYPTFFAVLFEFCSLCQGSTQFLLEFTKISGSFLAIAAVQLLASKIPEILGNLEGQPPLFLRGRRWNSFEWFSFHHPPETRPIYCRNSRQSFPLPCPV